MRSAEEERVATCDFADRIARLCIDEYKKRCPPFIEYKQTVIAGIILQTDDQQLFILGLGVGTKVPNVEQYIHKEESKIVHDTSSSISSHQFQYHEMIRDCHAEVLARRSFLKFLHNYLNKADRDIIPITSTTSAISATNSNDRSIYELSIFEKSAESGLLHLRKGFSLHLYSSSQPCGNAAIKKWAKSKAPIYYNLPMYQYPISLHNHPPFHVPARAEGQVALLVKKNANIHNKGNETISTTIDTDAIDSKIAISSQPLPQQLSSPTPSKIVVPEGMATVDSRLGYVMSCSDKIAKWNALGLQGSLLSAHFEPLYLSTITVGRKFSQIHCERAFCCRISSFQFPKSSSGKCRQSSSKPVNKMSRIESLPTAITEGKVTAALPTLSAPVVAPAVIDSTTGETEINKSRNSILYSTHHPAMLSTSIKLDTGVIYTSLTTTSECVNLSATTTTITTATTATTVEADTGMQYGAQFNESRCLAWWPGCEYDLNHLFTNHTDEPTSIIASTNSFESPSVSTSDSTMKSQVVSISHIQIHSSILILNGVTGYVDPSQFSILGQIPDSKEVSVLNKVVSPISSISFLSSHCNKDKRNTSTVTTSIQTQFNTYKEYKSYKQSVIESEYCSQMYSQARQVLITDSSLFDGWIDKSSYFDSA